MHFRRIAVSFSGQDRKRPSLTDKLGVLKIGMASVDESDKFGSFSMQIVDVKYRKKNNIKCSGRKRWCLLLIVLLMIAVVAGVTVGILKAIQSSESSGQYLKLFLSYLIAGTQNPNTFQHQTS